MKELIKQLEQHYSDRIAKIAIVDKAEIAITLKEKVDSRALATELKNHLIEMIDDLTIVQVDILNHKGELEDSFATNQ